MCDTLVATPETTARGRMLFAKNSDREASEPEVVELVPAAEHDPSGRTACTYLSVPAAPTTRRALLCRPYWMWGAEMGVNDAGVAIGNEAVFTRAPHAPTGLTGMDLVRLGLERASSARGAVELIGELLETHGQGGNSGHRHVFRYHNSFLIADPSEAWVLETAARIWVAKRVRGVRAISNGLTLGDDWELASEGLAARARDYGLSPGKSRLNFAEVFADRWVTLAAAADRRRSCSERFLRARREELSLPRVFAALRQHGSPDRPSAALGGLRQTVCAHAGWLPTRAHGQTTGSFVVELGDDGVRPFVTATSSPCISLFKPLSLADPLPNIGVPSRRYDPTSLWWRHELLHRAALTDLERALEHLRPAQEAFEQAQVEASLSGPAGDAQERSRAAFEVADGVEAEWLRALERRPSSKLAGFWRRLDADSGLARARAAALPFRAD